MGPLTYYPENVNPRTFVKGNLATFRQKANGAPLDWGARVRLRDAMKQHGLNRKFGNNSTAIIGGLAGGLAGGLVTQTLGAATGSATNSQL